MAKSYDFDQAVEGLAEDAKGIQAHMEADGGLGAAADSLDALVQRGIELRDAARELDKILTGL